MLTIAKFDNYCSSYLAACIDEVIVITFTSSIADASSDGDFDLELGVNGDLYIADFSTREKSGGNAWKFAISDFYGIPLSCVTKRDIEEITIEEDTNDAWNIQSVLTVLRAGGDYELVTLEMDVSQWIDGNGRPSKSLRRFKLNLLI